MKFIMILLCSLTLVGCGTLGGAVDGAGDDLNAAGKYIKNIGKGDK
jgi:predicted small secreted protein|tara:strand:- start:1754 stop:1891 length:138 start_codon:yes stop_codon:yes gene_type:complete